MMFAFYLLQQQKYLHMEIIEQLRLLFIIVMAYLSYREINRPALPYIDQEEDYESQIQPTSTPIQSTLNQTITVEVKADIQNNIVLTGNDAEPEERVPDKQIVTEQIIEDSSTQQQQTIEQGVFDEEEIVQEIQEVDDESQNCEKTQKTKKIRRTWKRTKKSQPIDSELVVNMVPENSVIVM